MADNKISMPSSGAGLTSFYNESTSKVRIAPQVILAVTILVIIIVMVLNKSVPVLP